MVSVVPVRSDSRTDFEYRYSLPKLYKVYGVYACSRTSNQKKPASGQLTPLRKFRRFISYSECGISSLDATPAGWSNDSLLILTGSVDGLSWWEALKWLHSTIGPSCWPTFSKAC